MMEIKKYILPKKLWYITIILVEYKIIKELLLLCVNIYIYKYCEILSQFKITVYVKHSSYLMNTKFKITHLFEQEYIINELFYSE